jgi:basic amino acid/polyamine antiporter, APA family
VTSLQRGPRGRSGVFRRKPVDEIASEHDGELSRSLGLWQLTAIGVGGIIGAGIFTLAGAVANQTACGVPEVGPRR